MHSPRPHDSFRAELAQDEGALLAVPYGKLVGQFARSEHRGPTLGLRLGARIVIDEHWPHPDSDGMPRRGGAPEFSDLVRDVDVTLTPMSPRDERRENLHPKA